MRTKGKLLNCDEIIVGKFKYFLGLDMLIVFGFMSIILVLYLVLHLFMNPGDAEI